MEPQIFASNLSYLPAVGGCDHLMLEVQMVAASPAAWASLVLVEGLVPLMAAGRYTRLGLKCLCTQLTAHQLGSYYGSTSPVIRGGQ